MTQCVKIVDFTSILFCRDLHTLVKQGYADFAWPYGRHQLKVFFKNKILELNLHASHQK